MWMAKTHHYALGKSTQKINLAHPPEFGTNPEAKFFLTLHSRICMFSAHFISHLAVSRCVVGEADRGRGRTCKERGIWEERATVVNVGEHEQQAGVGAN
jgi:hypothetical protein